jgi:hypothetical protein
VRLLRLAPSSLLAMAILLVGSGCSNDPSAEPSPYVTDPSTSSPTQSATTSPKPHDPIAFVRAWIATSNHALNTGDLSDLRSLVSPECLNCRRMLNAIESVYSRGGYIKTRGIGLTNAHLIGIGSPRKPVVSITIVTYPQIIRRYHNAPLTHTEIGHGGFTFWLKRQNGSFELIRMDPVT